MEKNHRSSKNLTAQETPIDRRLVKQKVQECRIKRIGTASIRELKRLVDNIESASGQSFIRMEMGVPGLAPVSIGVEAEIAALRRGVGAIYADIFGIQPLKQEIARFVKLFLDVEVSPEVCVPTVGSMQGSFAAFLTTHLLNPLKDTTLFIDPGFPVHKLQHQVLGLKWESFDVYAFRGEKLRAKLETYLKKGNIACILYSNPNNPSWICFTDRELRIIADLADRYDVVILEDLAYIGMDFRRDFSRPGVPPFQPTVAKYTGNYILFISSSKAFSYAGQRVGMMVISGTLFERRMANLKAYCNTDNFGHAIIFGTLYALSAGITHSAQYGLAAILQAVNDGTYNFVEEVKEYGAKARIMKKLFTDNGFRLVYDRDEDESIADGFYFTFSYPGFDGEELVEELLYYGISAISLAITGSERREGVRACVSLVRREQFPDLEYRLKKFRQHHPPAAH